MTYQPITAFQRAMDAGQLDHLKMVDQPLPAQGVNKWEVLRELIAGRAAYGLSDRDLSVLEALVSFHPGAILGGNGPAPVVHPSNVSICERLKGMACSTMRRHLARLVAAGFVVRRDSPNGKRYARRHGEERVVFGFDLSPLALRHAEICAAAETARSVSEQLRRLRETVSLMRRDAVGLATYGAAQRPDLGLWEPLSQLALFAAQALRRKLDIADLETLARDLRGALDRARDVLEGPVENAQETENMSTNVAPTEQHYQNSNTDLYDSESCQERARAAGTGGPETQPEDMPDRNLPNLPLGLVLSSCPTLADYSDGPIRHWHQLVQTAYVIRPMMGISPSAWEEAMRAMGAEQAAVVLAAMLERFEELRSPGGYLRALTAKAEAGAFSCGPMVMALMRKSSQL